MICNDASYFNPYIDILGFPDRWVVKNPSANAGDAGSIPGIGKIPWRRKWQPTPEFLPGNSHGQRRLASYSSWGHKESDKTEQLNNNKTHLYDFEIHNEMGNIVQKYTEGHHGNTFNLNTKSM